MILHKDATPNISSSDNEERVLQREFSGVEGKNEDENDALKIKLIKWLKENNLKLVASIMGDTQQNVEENVSEQVGIMDIRKKDLGVMLVLNENSCMECKGFRLIP